MLKNLKIYFLISFLTIVSNSFSAESLAKTAASEVGTQAIPTCTCGNPINPFQNQIIGSIASAGCGALCYVTLVNFFRNFIGLNDSQFIRLLFIAVSAFVPGLLWADFMDDGKINGSIFKDVIKGLTLDSQSLKNLFTVLIKKAGVVAVVTACLGAIMARRIQSKAE